MRSTKRDWTDEPIATGSPLRASTDRTKWTPTGRPSARSEVKASSHFMSAPADS